MPQAIRRSFGGAFRFAQLGGYPEGCRPFGEGLPREILKLVEDHKATILARWKAAQQDHKERYGK
jgi:hypothetical protein